MRIHKNQSTGGISRILSGVFGIGRPRDNASDEVNAGAVRGPYFYREGDSFTPGAQNYVFESALELPVVTRRGGSTNQGTDYPVTAWPVLQVPQVFAPFNNTTAGYGGLQAGQFIQQPLTDPTGV